MNCSYALRTIISNDERRPMKAIDQINLYDLATVFIAFGMMLGVAIH